MCVWRVYAPVRPSTIPNILIFVVSVCVCVLFFRFALKYFYFASFISTLAIASHLVMNSVRHLATLDG